MITRCRVCGDAISLTDPLNAGMDECFSCRHRRGSGLLSMTDAELLDGIDDLDAKISCADGIRATVFKVVKSGFLGEIGTRRMARRHLGLPEGFADR